MLEAPEETYAPERTLSRRQARWAETGARPNSDHEFDADSSDGASGRMDDATSSRQPRGGVRFRFNGRPVRMPKTLWGRIFSGAGLLAFLAVLVAAVVLIRSFFLHDPRFVIESSSSIQSLGNAHVTRAQLLSVFGEDVERNIFSIPLGERRAELEQLPWVEHATVMRLLPNHIRILITERTPVALVRQGTQLGMVDASGVLLDIPADTAADPHYSFPVITAGIGADDPLSTRMARMRIFGQFLGDLDSTGEHISKKVSEIDLADPEDVKALMFEGQSDVLVHFGESDFLVRYRKFEQHQAEWRAQYPKLSSVDMRYDRQVVLDMQPGSEVAVRPAAISQAGSKPALEGAVKPGSPAKANKGVGAGIAGGKKGVKPGVHPVPKARTTGVKVKPAAQTAPATSGQATPKPPRQPTAKTGVAPTAAWHMVVVKPHTKQSAALAAKPTQPHSSQASPK